VHGTERAQLAETVRARLQAVARYTDAYRRYCWPVDAVTDLKLAPFHLLASEKAVHVDKPHSWHMHHLWPRIRRAAEPRASPAAESGRKRSLAAREFALGVEGLERFVREEPLRRVHECCFGVLALESEPVDPRL
jgi:hypothetical protein